MDTERLLDSLDLTDLVGQVLCYDIYDKDDPAEVETVLAGIHPGALYLDNMSRDKIRMYTEMANRYTKLPVAIVTDVEYGPGENMSGLPVLPNVMAWSACDDAELVEQAAEIMAKLCRLHGISWTLSPVVDINMNFENPLVNVRSASDSPEQVKKIMGAFLRGIRKNGYMVATLKHFPGDGVDDRDQHFCTTVNSLSMTEWRKTFGNVYRYMIGQGADAVMCAHIGLPAYAGEGDALGAVSAVLSKPLMTDLLKGELGFDGCIISDAMSMVGSAARAGLEQLPVTFLQCGGDMVLFNEPEDHARIMAAVQNGTLPMERLRDAVSRVLRVKIQARLFEDQNTVLAEIPETKDALIERLNAIGDRIAERSIKFVRDIDKLLPLHAKPDSKFLCIEIADGDTDATALYDALRERGHTVEVCRNVGHNAIAAMMNAYDYVLVNCFFVGKHGGTMRAGWGQIGPFWRGYLLKHPRVIFTAFGDPYKLYDYPFLKTYINTFSYTESSMRAFVRVLLGEVDMPARNPVSLPGCFERETL